MKVVSPLILGFVNVQIAKQKAKELDLTLSGNCICLGKGSPEYDYVKALAGFKCRTVLVALDTNKPVPDLEQEVKSYIPRSFSGVFDGFSVVSLKYGLALVELYRK